MQMQKKINFWIPQDLPSALLVTTVIIELGPIFLLFPSPVVLWFPTPLLLDKRKLFVLKGFVSFCLLGCDHQPF